MNITHEEVAENSVEITLVLEPVDYNVALNKELKKIRKEVHMKGFRKGAAPLGFIKKMYGQKILEEEIPRLVGDSLREYTETNHPNMFFKSPVMISVPQTLDIKENKSYEFKYEIGLANELKASAYNEDSEKTFPYYEVDIQESDIEEKIADFLQGHSSIEDQEVIDEETNDVIGVLYELNDDLSVKDFKDSVVSPYCFLKPAQFDEATWKKLLGQTKGAAVDLNLTNAISMSEQDIMIQVLYKYGSEVVFTEANDEEVIYAVHEPESFTKFSDLEEARKAAEEKIAEVSEEVTENEETETTEGEEVEATEENTPKEISRKFRMELTRFTKNVSAVMNEEFFEQFEGQITDEAHLRDLIKQQIEQDVFIGNRVNLYKEVQKEIIEEVSLEVPNHYATTFFKDVNKSYLENQIKEKGVTMEELLEEQELQENLIKFKESLLASAIDEQLSTKLEIEVSEDEFRGQLMQDVERTYQQYKSYGYIQPNMSIQQFMEVYLKDQNNIHKAQQAIIRNKLVDKTYDVVKKDMKSVTLDEFVEITKQ